jgi:NAD+ kinase
MTSMLESTTHSPRAIKRATIIRHGKPETLGRAVERAEAAARARAVEIVDADHAADADLAVVLGGDGTMLRSLARFLGTSVPVIGVNFGRVGFLASIRPEEMESALARVFAGDYRVIELATLDVEVDGIRGAAINDVVAHSSVLGRMVELSWAVGGEDLGRVHCDGLVASTPSGSTAYNLSSGGPVLARSLDGMAITFVAPHSLHVRPLVIPRGVDLVVCNRTPDVDVAVIVDGHPLASTGREASVAIRLGEQRALLATLPETTFFGRFRETFVRPSES